MPTKSKKKIEFRNQIANSRRMLLTKVNLEQVRLLIKNLVEYEKFNTQYISFIFSIFIIYKLKPGC